MRVIAFTPNDCAEAVVATLMRGVVARLTKDDTVVDKIRPTELDVSDVMGMRALTKPVLGSICLPKM